MTYQEFVDKYKDWRTHDKDAAEQEAADVNFFAEKFKVAPYQLSAGLWCLHYDSDTGDFPWDLVQKDGTPVF